MLPIPLKAFTLLALAFLAGCETTLPEWRRFEVPEGTERVLVVDRHGLYFGEFATRSDPGAAVIPLFPEPMHPPHASSPMPVWLDQVDREVHLLLEQGILQRGENEWSYELVFPLSPLPTAYDANPEDTSQLWPDPLPPEEIVKLAKDHSSDAVVALEYLMIVVGDSTIITGDLPRPPATVSAPELPNEPYRENRTLHVNMKFGFRSYDAKSGEAIDQQVITQPNVSRWDDTGNAYSAANVEQTKLAMARGTITFVARELDKALIARDIKIH